MEYYSQSSVNTKISIKIKMDSNNAYNEFISHLINYNNT